MTPKTHAKRPAAILLPLFLLIFSTLFTSCGEYWRDYREDVVVKDNFSDYRLIFREWSVLGGGGAKIYCRKGNGREKQLGEISLGDSVFPFTKGKYTVEWRGDSVCIRFFSGRGSETDDPDTWQAISYDLP